MTGDHRERLGELAPVPAIPRGDDDALGGLEQCLGGAALVEHGKLRRDIGLQREAAQQCLAEGVDRGDLDAARGVEDAGEELPRLRHHRIVRISPGQLVKLLEECVMRQRHPLGEPLVEPVGHLRGGRARKGQAQDARGIAAFQHQPEQPVGQHLGLAGAGRSRDPGRNPGCRRPALRRSARAPLRSFLVLSRSDPLEVAVVGKARRPLRHRLGEIGCRRVVEALDQRSDPVEHRFGSACRDRHRRSAGAPRPEPRRSAANIRAPQGRRRPPRSCRPAGSPLRAGAAVQSPHFTSFFEGSEPVL